MNEPSKAFMEALNAAMHAHPNQRAAQVIVNALGPDPFYVSDDAATTSLWAYARKDYTHD